MRTTRQAPEGIEKDARKEEKNWERLARIFSYVFAIGALLIAFQ
jgi:hypothetical protein